MVVLPRRVARSIPPPVLKLVPGPVGLQGSLGDRGEKGDRGDQGESGRNGLNGNPGRNGEQGIQGLKGDTGERGLRGFRGLEGKDGPRGESGRDGMDGKDADNDATFLTREDERKTLPNSEQLVAGSNIRFDRTQKGKLILHSDSRAVRVGGGSLNSGTGDGVIVSLVEGDGIDIDATDPTMPVVGVSAPQDGTTYGIKDGAWVPVTTDAAQIEYMIQTEASKYWLDSDFVFGNNVIGVRTAGAEVYIPHDLSSRKLVTIKDETGDGATVYPY